MVTVALGCRKNPDIAGKRSPTPAPSLLPSAAHGSVQVGIPAPSASVEKLINPLGAKPYAGPIGTVRGLVRVTGDPAPPRDASLPKLPADCPGAVDLYAKRFREGPGRALADVLVAVTDYGPEYLPAPGPSRRIEVGDCGWDSRTMVLMFGQDLTVVNAGHKPHVPELLGAHSSARLVSVPGGDPVKLYPMRPSRYLLVDMMNLYMQADVFVVKYPTVSVTGLDGRFTIPRVPAKEVTVNAFSPHAELVDQRKVRVLPGQTVEVDFTLAFDQKRHEAASGSASAQAAAAPPSAGSATHGSAPRRVP